MYRKDRRYFKFPDLNTNLKYPRQEKKISKKVSIRMKQELPPKVSRSKITQRMVDGIKGMEFCVREIRDPVWYTCYLQLCLARGRRSMKPVMNGDISGNIVPGECLLPPAMEQWKCKF